MAARHGLAPAQVLKFDQNTPPLPGVPQVPLAESFATLNEYPSGRYRELREAAAGYVSRQTSTDVDWEQIVIGAGADDLILLCARTYLAPGRSASIVSPAYSMYRIATLLNGAEPTSEAEADSRPSSGAATPTTPPDGHACGGARRARPAISRARPSSSTRPTSSTAASRSSPGWTSART